MYHLRPWLSILALALCTARTFARTWSGAPDAPKQISAQSYIRREVVVHNEPPLSMQAEKDEEPESDEDEAHLTMADPDNDLPPEAWAIFNKAKAKTKSGESKKKDKSSDKNKLKSASPAARLLVSNRIGEEKPEAVWHSYMERARAWDEGQSVGAVSGEGSEARLVKPFVGFLERWLKARDVHSLVEASTGHWPSGWQRNVSWPALDYIGVDILPEMVRDNRALLEMADNSNFGLRQAQFQVGDMLKEALPPADVLLTKDTLIHFTNRDIKNFLEKSVTQCPPLFKYAIFVHDQNEPAGASWRDNNKDIPAMGRFHPLDLAAEPFNLPVETVFSWEANSRKVLQLFDAGSYCSNENDPVTTDSQTVWDRVPV